MKISQPFWSSDQKLLYGKVYKIASDRYGAERASILAEAHIFKLTHDHLKFNSQIERELKDLLGKA